MFERFFYSRKRFYVHCDLIIFLFTSVAFLYSLESLTRIEYIFGFMDEGSTIARLPISSLILPATIAFKQS